MGGAGETDWAKAQGGGTCPADLFWHFGNCSQVRECAHQQHRRIRHQPSQRSREQFPTGNQNVDTFRIAAFRRAYFARSSRLIPVRDGRHESAGLERSAKQGSRRFHSHTGGAFAAEIGNSLAAASPREPCCRSLGGHIAMRTSSGRRATNNSGAPRELPGLRGHLDLFPFFNEEGNANLEAGLQPRGFGHAAA